MNTDQAFKNSFMYRTAVQQNLIKKGLRSEVAVIRILKNVDFVHQAYEEMQPPEDTASCIS